MTGHEGSRRPVWAAFFLSGVAGLAYEVLWSRYLGLYVGHAAFAQVLVLAVYMGGMAVGALSVAGLRDRVASPLRAYAITEALLGVFGLAFHIVFVWTTEASYDLLFPALGGAGSVGAARWGIAGLLVLPQALLLGATYPFMAAGIVRSDPGRPGRAIALVYLVNTLGGAAGILVTGFVLIGWIGLAGASVVAGALNLVAAGIAWRRAPAWDVGEPVAAEPVQVAPRGGGGTAPAPAGLGTLLLTAAFVTALASFAYEIGWIRMLSLVLGSATHAFELMLSAFVLGLAVGSWWIRDRMDRSPDAVRLLGGIQVAMGLAALISLPVYLLTFDLMAPLVRDLPGRPLGYMLFNVARYGLCLLVMLPATLLAGMTLPVVTGALLGAGLGERMIGTAYAANTVGSVVGAGVAGLIALPLLGLEGLVAAGAGVDAALGLALLAWSWRAGSIRPRMLAFAAGTSVALFAVVPSVTDLDPVRLSSGVFRNGALPTEAQHLSLYYQDGRTATVSAHVGRSDGVIVLATNGKPDASIGPRWIMDGRDTLPVLPIPAGRDFTTQILAPMLALAYQPSARNIVNVGHGSGLTASAFLTSAEVERLVTIEIEPLMVEGSLVFLPANETAFSDPRASFVFDDAKSWFSFSRETFDVIYAEPSNPWVSGTASLFTEEFYRRVAGFLNEGGVLGQWMHIYELDDDLFLSFLAALDAVFPYHRAYLVGDADIAIVARRDRPFEDPDWSVMETPAFERLTVGAPRFGGPVMDALLLWDQSTVRPLLEAGVRPNSDYRPVLDVGAERTRFLRTYAEGVYSFAESRVDLGRVLAGESLPPAPYATVPAYGLLPAVMSGRAAWLRDALANGGGIAPEEFPEWGAELIHLQRFLEESSGSEPPPSWEAWADGFSRAEAALHWGTVGWADSTLYRVVRGYLDRTAAPPDPRAAVDLTEGFALGDWPRAARAADRLTFRVAAGQRWAVPAALLDMAVVAHLRAGAPDRARAALDQLGPRTGRGPRHLRMRLLDALVTRAQVDTGTIPGG